MHIRGSASKYSRARGLDRIGRDTERTAKGAARKLLLKGRTAFRPLPSVFCRALWVC